MMGNPSGGESSWWKILFGTSARGLISCRGLSVEAPGLSVGDRGGGLGAFLSGDYLLSADGPAAFVFSALPNPFSPMTGPEREIGLVVLEVHPATPEYLKEAMPFVGERLGGTAEESSLPIAEGHSLSVFLCGQQSRRRTPAHPEGEGHLVTTGVRNFRWAHRGYTGPESLRRVDFLPVWFRSAGSSTSGSMYVNRDLLSVEPEIGPNCPRGNRDTSSAMQPAQTSSPGPVVAA